MPVVCSPWAHAVLFVQLHANTEAWDGCTRSPCCHSILWPPDCPRCDGGGGAAAEGLQALDPRTKTLCSVAVNGIQSSSQHLRKVHMLYITVAAALLSVEEKFFMDSDLWTSSHLPKDIRDSTLA